MRKETLMARVIGVMCTIVTAVAVVGVANGASPLAWTAPKAERMLVQRAAVGVPASEKALLVEELRRSVAQFRALQTWAQDAGDEAAFWTYFGWANRYDAALRSVERGLSIAAAACIGSGREITAARYSRFDCLATSEVVRIPSTSLGESDGAMLPSVVEGESRELGPFVLQVRVRVTGNSSFRYQ
jgi:hypothetical protein